MVCEQCEQYLTRLLDAEREFAAYVAQEGRREPVIEYVERKVYKPMPPREVVKKITVVRTVEVECWAVRPAGFFGSLGDRIDRLLRREGAQCF